MGADALLRGLDETQRLAACHPGGPGGGHRRGWTGKTRVLVARVAWLIESGRVAPQHVCALTFMNDSANEIGERLAHASARRSPRRSTSTGHRLANAILRSCATTFGRAERYSIWDAGDAARALEEHGRVHGAPLSVAATRARAATAAHRLESPWQAARRSRRSVAVRRCSPALAGY